MKYLLTNKEVTTLQSILMAHAHDNSEDARVVDRIWNKVRKATKNSHGESKNSKRKEK